MMGAAITAMFGWIVKNQNDRLTEKDQQAKDTKADFEKQITKVEDERDQLAGELKATVLKATETVLAQQEGTQQELAELRKTNLLLIAKLSGKDGVS
ncbi:MAG: hypothetical protein ACR2M1_12415 [Gemmatimonadaceae bacterium]